MTRTKKIVVASALLFTPAIAWAATEAPGLCESICAMLGMGCC